ncbi:HigA family addiction module antitoxin [Methylorubrum populi]
MPNSPSAPPHPGAVLREQVLPGLGLSVTRASRELGVCRQTLHRVLAGTAAVTPDMAVRLGRLSGLPGDFWLSLQQTHDLARAATELAAILPGIPAHSLPAALKTELTGHARTR